MTSGYVYGFSNFVWVKMLTFIIFENVSEKSAKMFVKC